jgi:hypothetical protein
MAKKARPRATPKKQTAAKAQAKKPTVPKERAAKLLAKVPEENIFWCYGGATFRDLGELAQGLAAMSDEVFGHHVNAEKNDFCNWIRDVIADAELAGELAAATTRLQAADCVSARVALLLGE